MAKSKLQQLKLSKKQARAQRSRAENQKHEIVRFLIVCEGTKTEPNYFKALIKDRYSSIREVTVEGEGRTTVALVKEAKNIREREESISDLKFDRVWVVFDQDDKPDFNEAIHLARKLRYKSAWTNEAFELWYLLHFQYLDTGITRKAYIEKLEGILRSRLGRKDYKYEKNDEHFYHLLQEVGGNEEMAKNHAKKLRKKYRGTDYSSHKPCTHVDELVEELENTDKVLDEINNS